MQYQLDDRMLMDLGLSPAHLIATRLVGSGLLTTAHIRTLGSIQRELQTVGLDYRLQDLALLLDMVTPEQLQAVGTITSGDVYDDVALQVSIAPPDNRGIPSGGERARKPSEKEQQAVREG